MFPHKFKPDNVLGLPGRVFGRHHHQRKGNKVNPTRHPNHDKNVKIRWPTKLESGGHHHKEDGPTLVADEGHWSMFDSDLDTVEGSLAFSVTGHCADLAFRSLSRKPVILEWGCGRGNAVRDLTNLLSKGSALIFGYGDVWDIKWNEIPGVKFLFFVKEHLAEYFRRSNTKIDFIFAHGSLEYLMGEELISHLRDLASVMNPGASIALPAFENPRPEFHELSDIFHLSEGIIERERYGKLPCILTKR
jgi:SAM-dependent methyltransferase